MAQRRQDQEVSDSSFFRPHDGVRYRASHAPPETAHRSGRARNETKTEDAMRDGRPITLVVVGDSAAGKTTMIEGIKQILGADRVTDICTDDYHRYDRAERKHV